MQPLSAGARAEAQSVLAQLNTVPGVAGSMLCDDEGRCVANALPPRYGDDLLARAARLVADGKAGLGAATSDVSSIDFRFGESRLVLRPLPEGALLVLCSADTNPYFLAPSLAAVSVRLARLHVDEPARPSPGVAPPEPPGEAAGRRRPKTGVPVPTRGLEELYRRLGQPKGK